MDIDKFDLIKPKVVCDIDVIMQEPTQTIKTFPKRINGAYRFPIFGKSFFSVLQLSIYNLSSKNLEEKVNKTVAKSESIKLPAVRKAVKKEGLM